MLPFAVLLFLLLQMNAALAAGDLCAAASREIDASLRAFAPPIDAKHPGDRISIANAARRHKAAGLDFGARMDAAQLGAYSLGKEDRALFDDALGYIYRAGGDRGLVMLDAVAGTAYCHNPFVFSLASGAAQRLKTPETEPFSLCANGGVALGAAAGTPFYAETSDDGLENDELKIFSVKGGALTQACAIAAHYQIVFATAESFCKDAALCRDYGEKIASWAERLRGFGFIDAPELAPAKDEVPKEVQAELPLFGAKGSALVPEPFRFSGAESWLAIKNDRRVDALRIGPAHEGPPMMADWASFTLASLYKDGRPVASFVVEKRRGVFQELATFEKLGPEASPTEVVAALYRAEAGVGGDYARSVSVFADPLGREYFLSAGLRRALAAMDKRTPAGYAPDLDFDPVTDSQDPDVRDLKIVAVSNDGKTAKTRVEFRRGGEKNKPIALIYSLVRESDGWRVDDIAEMRQDGWRLGTLVKRD